MRAAIGLLLCGLLLGATATEAIEIQVNPPVEGQTVDGFWDVAVLGGLLLGAMVTEAFCDADTVAVRLDVVYDDKAGGESSWGGELGFGIAIFPRTELGLLGQYAGNDMRIFRLAGLYLEESFNLWGPLYPFLGVGGGYAWVNSDEAGDGSSWVARFAGGLRMVLSDRWAVSLSALFYLSNNDIFLRDGPEDVIDRHWQFSAGIRFCF